MVSGSKKLIRNTFECILQQQLIFLCAQHNPDRRIIIILTYLCLEIVQVKIHLTYVSMLDLTPF